MSAWGNFASVIAQDDKKLVERNQRAIKAGPVACEIREKFRDVHGNKMTIVHAVAAKAKPKASDTINDLFAKCTGLEESLKSPPPTASDLLEEVIKKAMAYAEVIATLGKEKKTAETAAAMPSKPAATAPIAAARVAAVHVAAASLPAGFVPIAPTPAGSLSARPVAAASMATACVAAAPSPAGSLPAAPTTTTTAEEEEGEEESTVLLLALDDIAELRLQLEVSEGRVSGLVNDSNKLESDVGFLKQQVNGLAHQLSGCQQFADQAASQLQWTTAQYHAVCQQFHGLQELVAASGNAAEGCTGSLQCTSCTYHLQLNLHISRRASSEALKQVDSANLKILRLVSELDDAQRLARREDTEEDEDEEEEETASESGSDLSGSDSELEIIGCDESRTQPAAAAAKEVTDAANEQPMAAVAPAPVLPPIVEETASSSDEEKKTTEAAREQPPTTTTRKDFDFARRSFLTHLTGLKPDRKFVPRK